MKHKKLHSCFHKVLIIFLSILSPIFIELKNNFFKIFSLKNNKQQSGNGLFLTFIDLRMITTVIGVFVFGFSSFAVAQVDSDFSAGGGIKIGASTSACDGSTAGALRYNSGNGCIEFCGGATWECINATGSCDGAPAPYNFTDISAAAQSVAQTSDILLFAGTDAACSSSVGISGGGSPEYRVCSNATCSTEIQTWGSANTSHDVSSSTYMQVRDISAATDNTVVTVTLSVGGVENEWTISTGASGSCGASPAIGQVCADGSVYAGVTPDGNQHMYVARCDLGMSWDGTACSGTRSTLDYNAGNSSGIALVGALSGIAGELNTATLVSTDSNTVTAGVQDHLAAQACEDLNVHGNTDWYLPAWQELRVVYENLMDGVPNDNAPDPVISGISTASYWSSSENTSTHSAYIINAFKLSFSNGSVDDMARHNNYAVRCARQD
jgi:hypothetical protein